MEAFKIKDELILLNQLLKAMGWCETGGDANAAIEAGSVLVNGKIETRKRNKLRAGDKIEYNKRCVHLK